MRRATRLLEEKDRRVAKAKNKRDTLREKSKRHRAALNRPFVMVDGEGGGLDKKGRQNYLMIRAGDVSTLYCGGEPLFVDDILEFILDLPNTNIYFWFGGNYDSTMILRDLPRDVIWKLCNIKGYTWYKDYGIEWHPKHYLSVCRLTKDRKIVKGSIRTINEVFGFFQSSFYAACIGFQVGTKEQMATLAANKAARSDFVTITAEIDQYNSLECALGRDLMEKLRKLCYDANIYPNTWRGAGSIATALHNQYSTPKAKDCNIPNRILELAKEAYYGGRFEISAHGQIDRPIYEYDIRSAYPASMSALPCLVHGTWRQLGNARLGKDGNILIASVEFENSPSCFYGLPVRTEDGYLLFPRRGTGCYFGYELHKFKGRLKIKEQWVYEKRCDCNTFEWVRSLYNYRRTLTKLQGYPIKLGINALYGKLAQRNPTEGPWTNYVWAGMITSMTRARLLEAMNGNEDDIIMCATDGIYSLSPLTHLPCSGDLGDWEETTYSDGLFIAQPGVYWSPDEKKIKTRGISQREFERARSDIERQFHEWDGSGEAPMTIFPTARFRGLKAANRQNNEAGVWSISERHLSMDYTIKRESVYRDGDIMRSRPHDGFYRSCAHGATTIEEDAAEDDVED
jgi:hypothetical protein